MTKEHLEKDVATQNSPEKSDYQRYLDLGGIINEKDYKSALERTGDATVDEITISQVRGMKNFAKIESLNPLAIKLYGILLDIKPKEILDSDWRLFRESLRMLEDTDSLSKLKFACHTNRRPGTYCPLCGQTQENEDCP